MNRTEDFSEIEKLEISFEKDGDQIDIITKKDQTTFKAKKLSSLWFLLKRYPVMVIPTLLLTIAFLFFYPIVFIAYIIFTTMLFIFMVRFCVIHKVGTYIMVFWVIHLVTNFILLGMTPINLGIEAYMKQEYIKGLFFGMMLTHLWVYMLIFMHKYHLVYNLLEKDENDVMIATNWFIWQNCSMCNKKYSLFKKNCDVLK